MCVICVYVCVSDLCVSDLCVSDLCVCVCEMWRRRATGEAEEAGG